MNFTKEEMAKFQEWKVVLLELWDGRTIEDPEINLTPLNFYHWGVAIVWRDGNRTFCPLLDGLDPATATTADFSEAINRFLVERLDGFLTD